MISDIGLGGERVIVLGGGLHKQLRLTFCLLPLQKFSLFRQLHALRDFTIFASSFCSFQHVVDLFADFCEFWQPFNVDTRNGTACSSFFLLDTCQTFGDFAVVLGHHLIQNPFEVAFVAKVTSFCGLLILLFEVLVVHFSARTCQEARVRLSWRVRDARVRDSSHAGVYAKSRRKCMAAISPRSCSVLGNSSCGHIPIRKNLQTRSSLKSCKV